MPTQICPMLAVSDGSGAIEFYKVAFGAKVLWQIGRDQDVIAGLEIEGRKFFLAHESPPHRTRGPAAAGFTTVRIELFRDDPRAVQRSALSAGAVERSRLQEHQHTTTGSRTIQRMLQAAVVDPFGRMRLVGKVLE